MAMRSLEEKVAFCLNNKVQKGPGPYYALKSSQRDEPVKKKIGVRNLELGIRRLKSFEADFRAPLNYAKAELSAKIASRLLGYLYSDHRLASNCILISYNKVKKQKQPSRGALRKGAPKIHNKTTGEHPRRSTISTKLPCNFTEIAFRHGRSPANPPHISRTPSPKNISRRLLPKK